MEEFQSSKYIHKFKSTLDDMSLYCNIPLGVIRSSESITRKPFWPWIRTKALEQLTENPLEVVNFFWPRIIYTTRCFCLVPRFISSFLALSF